MRQEEKEIMKNVWKEILDRNRRVKH